MATSSTGATWGSTSAVSDGTTTDPGGDDKDDTTTKINGVDFQPGDILLEKSAVLDNDPTCYTTVADAAKWNEVDEKLLV